MFLLGLLFCIPYARAQENSRDFIKYLYNTKQFKHLITYNQYIKGSGINSLSNDSLNYLTGKSYFQMQEYVLSNYFLDSLERNFIQYDESRFLMSANSNQLGLYNQSIKQLESIPVKDSIIYNFKYFELAGVALLKRDMPSYFAYDSLIQKNYYFFESERQSIAHVADNLNSRKNKSPWVGGVLSALVPGAGRFYAGKRGQAIYSFVIATFLGLQTWESYNKNGINSARFITYGSLFSLFHLGNIWGSALAVKNYNNEYNEAADYRIKMDLLIPVRSFYK